MARRIDSGQIEDLLGSEFSWTARTDRGFHTVFKVQIIGYDPDRGVRLACPGYESSWCSVADFFRLQEEGVLVAS